MVNTDNRPPRSTDLLGSSCVILFSCIFYDIFKILFVFLEMIKTFLQLYSVFVVREYTRRSFMVSSSVAAQMKAVRMKKFGDPSQLYIEGNEPLPELASKDDVLLRVAATALNRADTLQRKGGYSPPKGASDILGLEASGVVDKIGENVMGFK